MCEDNVKEEENSQAQQLQLQRFFAIDLVVVMSSVNLWKGRQMQQQQRDAISVSRCGFEDFSEILVRIEWRGEIWLI